VDESDQAPSLPDRRMIVTAVERREDALVALLQDLVRFRSVNPVFANSVAAEEGRLQAFLAARLRGLGFETDLFEPDPVALARYRGKPGFQEGRRFEGRPNLAARLRGSGDGRSVMLACHIDVVGVDASERWTVDPFGGELRDGRVWGRGSADMKGGAACMVAALETLLELELGPGGDVIWASVVDEETGGMGTLALVDRGYRADAAFMPEPTATNLVPMCRGILWGEIVVRGRSSHIEIPQPPWQEGGAVDAIAKARVVLDSLDRLNEEWAARPEKTHPLLGVPNQVFVSMVRAGQHPSSWAEEARITFDAQYTANERDENGLGGRVKTDLERQVAAAAAADPWLAQHPPEIRWTVDADPGEIDPEHEFVACLRRACADAGLAGEFGGVGYHTDSSLLIGAGVPTIVFGPGNPDDAHQVDENVAVEDLVAVTKAIALTLVEWGGWEPAARRAS
jgi:acetylornithine deacetylase